MSTLERFKALWGRSPATAGTVANPAAAPARPGSGRERRRQPRSTVAGGLHALVVDDSPTVVAVLRKMLRQNHYQVAEAADAETGMALARAQRPDIVFLDIVLPGISGFEALRQLRRDAATSDVPVIMISGNAQATEQFYVQRIGADDFLRKPFSRAEVFASVTRLLDHRGIPRRQDAAAAAAAADASPVQVPSVDQAGA